MTEHWTAASQDETQDETREDEELLLWTSKGSGSWGKIYSWWGWREDCGNDNKGLGTLQELGWQSSSRLCEYWLGFWKKFSCGSGAIQQRPEPQRNRRRAAESASHCGTLHCYLILRSCHGRPNLRRPPPRSVGSRPHWAKTLHQQKDDDSLKV